MAKGDFFSALDKASGYMLLNLLWVLLAIPVVTLPAATGGLFAVMTDAVRGKETDTFYRFFGAMREYWLKSTLIAVADVVVLGLVIFNLGTLPDMELPVFIMVSIRWVVILVGLVALAVNLYLWPLMVMYELPLFDLAEISLKLVFNHFGWSLGLLGIAVIAIVFGVTLPGAAVVFVLFSGWVWIICWGAWRVIQQYDDEL